jgi:hypothetical protein
LTSKSFRIVDRRLGSQDVLLLEVLLDVGMFAFDMQLGCTPSVMTRVR